MEGLGDYSELKIRSVCGSQCHQKWGHYLDYNVTRPLRNEIKHLAGHNIIK